MDATSNMVSKTKSCIAPFRWCQKDHLGILRLFRQRSRGSACGIPEERIFHRSIVRWSQWTSISNEKGALHISMQSNVPIAPMRFKTSPSFEISNWDRRKFPLPFSNITVEFGEPIQITKDNFEMAYDIISKSLG
jgi:hypothetical protein